MDSLICTSRGSKLPSLMPLENAPSAAECFDRRLHDKSATFPAPPTPAAARFALLLRSKLPKLQRATCDPRRDSLARAAPATFDASPKTALAFERRSVLPSLNCVEVCRSKSWLDNSLMQRTLVPTQPRVRDISVKLLLIGGTVAVGVVLAVALSYFSLAHFFTVNARAKDGLAQRSRKSEKDSDTERATVNAKKRGAGVLAPRRSRRA